MPVIWEQHLSFEFPFERIDELVLHDRAIALHECLVIHSSSFAKHGLGESSCSMRPYGAATRRSVGVVGLNNKSTSNAKGETHPPVLVTTTVCASSSAVRQSVSNNDMRVVGALVEDAAK